MCSSAVLLLPLKLHTVYSRPDSPSALIVSAPGIPRRRRCFPFDGVALDGVALDGVALGGVALDGIWRRRAMITFYRASRRIRRQKLNVADSARICITPLLLAPTESGTGHMARPGVADGHRVGCPTCVCIRVCACPVTFAKSLTRHRRCTQCPERCAARRAACPLTAFGETSAAPSLL